MKRKFLLPLLFLVVSLKAFPQTMDLIYYNTVNNPGVFLTNNFKTIGIGKGGVLWAGTANLGLYKNNGTYWQKFGGLVNNNINDIKTDFAGGIWVAQSGNTGAQALSGGIDYFPDSSFNYTAYGTLLGLPTRYVKSLYVNNSVTSLIGSVWSAHLANVTGGVSSTGSVGRGVFISPPSPFYKITTGVDISGGLGSVQAIGGNSSEVWAYALNNFGHNQILRYNFSDGSFISYYDDSNSPLPAGFTVKSIYSDSRKRFWIGMSNGGVYIYDAGTWTQLIIPSVLTATTNVNANAVAGDNHGNIFIGTTMGLVVCNGGNYTVTTAFTLYTTANGLPSNNVQGIATDSITNNPYTRILATDNGICRWNPEGLIFYHVYKHNPLNRDSVGTANVTDIKVAADSSSETLIKIIMSGANQCNLRVKQDLGPIFSPTLYGYFIPYKRYADSILYFYHHPSNANLGSNYSRQVQFEVYDTVASVVKSSSDIKIVRPPLLLAHGIFGTGETTFGNMRRKLISDNLYRSGQVFAIDYPNDADFVFAVNVLKAEKDTALKNALFVEKILCSKLDVAGHSMGGLILRKYLHSRVYNNDINKYVSINTPHSGSQIANFVLTYLNFLNPVIKSFAGNPQGGALKDLSITTDPTDEIHSLNALPSYENKVPTHVIATTQTLSSQFFQNVPVVDAELWVVALIGTKAFSYFYWDGLYENKPHDLVVEGVSQLGGLNAKYYTLIDNQWHGSTVDPNPFVYNEFVRLMNADPDDGNIFTRGGFKPPPLTLPSDLQLPVHVNSPNASIRITSPILGTDFQTNATINVNFNYVAIDSFVLIIGSLTNPLNVYQINSPATSISIPVPKEYFGNTEILILGFNQGGYAAMDSVHINISTTATLDSIFSNPESVTVIRTHNRLINTYGYFSDSVIRNLTGIVGLTYYFKNNKASFQSPNAILGVANGYDTLTISYAGKNLSIPIQILDSSEWISSGDFTLPLMLKYFTGSLNLKQTSLNWISSNEFNSSHFDIERSIDGSKFDKIAIVNATGNSAIENKYQYIDKQLPTSSIIYYRLKIVDKDGKFVYSNVIIIRTENSLNNSVVFPNPVNSLLNVQLNGYKGNVSLKIFDYQGKELREQNFITEGPLSSTIYTKDLPAGTYIISISSKDKNERISFVKQ